MSKPVVGLALPSRSLGTADPEALTLGIVHKASERADYAIMPAVAWKSILTSCFNLLWVSILNERKRHGVTHFAMLHDDIVPQPGWLDVLLDELDRTGADLVSSVVPIKVPPGQRPSGLTSTALDSTGDKWNPQRLVMKEINALPETFSQQDTGAPLLLNTGCWVCRLDRPWVPNVCFRQQDEIRLVDGEYQSHTIPEDWDFSRQVSQQGGKLVATRKVRLYHERPEFTNQTPWGEWETDRECQKFFGDRAPNANKLTGLNRAVVTGVEPLELKL